MASRAEDLFAEIKANQGRIEDWFKEKMADDWMEHVFLDFKSHDLFDRVNQGFKKYEEFKASVSKAASAFANTEGGVLLIGLECRKINGSRDIVQSYVPLVDCEEAEDRFRKIKMDLTNIPISRLDCLPLKTGQGKQGYLAIFIPQGEHTPYRSAYDEHYYGRTIDSTFLLPHEMLRNLFYPKSKVGFEAHYDVERTGNMGRDVTFRISARVKNIGNATAENIFVEARISPSSPLNLPHSVDGLGTQYSRQLKPRPRPSYVDTSIAVKRDLHPQHKTDKVFCITYGGDIKDYVDYSNEGDLNHANNVILDSGVTLTMKIFSRNSLLHQHTDTISWPDLQQTEHATFFLSEVLP